MTDASFDRMMQAARTGRLSRRDVLERGLKLGMSTAAISTLMAAAPEVGAAPRPLSLRDLARSQGSSTGTFTMLRAEGAPDLDPHYQYNNANAAILLATTEMLIQYKGESTFDYEP
ncbi:MAG TPA: ABC transporter substrate-binding protein, partial [Thermomicrobiales bacterium]|nr:ABC transporter substrate-binding protein [Thermomicrobiales bacterium]